jgi:hypothetical protein
MPCFALETTHGPSSFGEKSNSLMPFCPAPFWKLEATPTVQQSTLLHPNFPKVRKRRLRNLGTTGSLMAVNVGLIIFTFGPPQLANSIHFTATQLTCGNVDCGGLRPMANKTGGSHAECGKQP